MMVLSFRILISSIIEQFLELDLIAGGIPVPAEQELPIRAEGDGLDRRIELARDE